MELYMSPNFITSFFMAIPLWPLHLLAQQKLDNFFEFEGISAEETTFIFGKSPNSIQVINFSLETGTDPALAHSGTRH